MRILCILTAWNEIEFLPLKKRFCEANGIDLYVIDNYSDDGTWEWLQKNGVPSHRFDTNGSFNLRKLQDEIVRTIHEQKPDWVIYNGADLFPVTDKPLYKEIQMLNDLGCNVAMQYCISFYNTGEERNPKDPFNTYFHFRGFQYLTMIHKYHPEIIYNADHVTIGEKIQPGNIGGILINYGNTKTAQERNQSFERRKKAWVEGENPAHGSHFREGAARDWTWNKEELTDIRETEYFRYLQKLQYIFR